MKRQQLGWFMALVVLTMLVAASAPAFPMMQEKVEADSGPAAAEQDSEAVETILREQEQLLRGQRFSYDPAGRRDPFRSLFEANTVEQAKRPRGVAGMLVAELDLKGIVRDSGRGDVAFVTGTDNNGYFLRVGDAVYDGTIISVDPRLGTVTFRQQVDDPKIIKPYRDVVKRLEPLEESVDE